MTEKNVRIFFLLNSSVYKFNLADVFLVEGDVFIINGILLLEKAREVGLDGGVEVVVAAIVLAGTSSVEMADLGLPFLEIVDHGAALLVIHTAIPSIFT